MVGHALGLHPPAFFHNTGAVWQGYGVAQLNQPVIIVIDNGREVMIQKILFLLPNNHIFR